MAECSRDKETLSTDVPDQQPTRKCGELLADPTDSDKVAAFDVE
jgi:hypothetical protein